MPVVSVNGVSIAYDVLGKGSPIVWTPWAWAPRNNDAYLAAGHLSAFHKVLTWDRRNTGESSICIEDVPSEFHLYTDDLHHLLNALDMSPAYIAGLSGASIFSLLMAHRYPEDVKGLILSHPVTDNPEIFARGVHARHFELADVAEREGMEGVLAHSTQAWVRLISGQSKPENSDGNRKWLAETVQANPHNRQRLLSMDPEQFASIMRKWGRWILSERLSLANLSDDDLSQITVPTLIRPGGDEAHPRHTAEALHRLLPNSELSDALVGFSQEEREQKDIFLPFIEEFLQRVESR